VSQDLLITGCDVVNRTDFVPVLADLVGDEAGPDTPIMKHGLKDVASPVNGHTGPTPNNTPAGGPLPQQPVEMLLDRAMHELKGVRC
jgi:hypothetical protein